MIFTKQERVAICIVCLCFACGLFVQGAVKVSPRVKRWLVPLESDYLYPKTNINTASMAELMDIPYIGEKTAQRIVTYRQTKGFFKRVEDIQTLKGIYPENYQILKHYISVH